MALNFPQSELPSGIGGGSDLWDAGPGAILGDDYFAAGSSNQSLTASLFSNSSAFYAATVSNAGGGDQALTASRLDNSQSFFAATVAPGAVALAPSLCSNSSTFYSLAVAVGAASLQPELFVNANEFHPATVYFEGGSQSLTASLLVNQSSVFDFTVEHEQLAIASLGASPVKQNKREIQETVDVAKSIAEPVPAEYVSRMRNEFLSESLAHDLIERARVRKSRAEEEALLLMI